MGQEGHALHRSHRYIERTCYIHWHRRSDGHGMRDVHVGCGRDVHGRQVNGAGYGDRGGVLQIHRRGDVHRIRSDVHLRRDGDRVVGVPVHSRRSNGRGVGDRRCTG